MNTVITIGRQFGSAGREIGEKLAANFGIKCYDKELLSRAAKESGFCEEMIQNHDERPTNSFLYNLVMDTYSFGYNASSFVDMPISHKVFLAQFDTIKKIADEGPCVIVGRCADYALADYKNCINLFIFGDDACEIQRVFVRAGFGRRCEADFITKRHIVTAHAPDQLDCAKVAFRTASAVILHAKRSLILGPVHAQGLLAGEGQSRDNGMQIPRRAKAQEHFLQRVRIPLGHRIVGAGAGCTHIGDIGFDGTAVSVFIQRRRNGVQENPAVVNQGFCPGVEAVEIHLSQGCAE